jgi:hypothetical protein
MQRPTSTRYFAGLSRNTFLLAFASLFADISTEMLYPVLPIFLTQTLKASGSIVGPAAPQCWHEGVKTIFG